MSIHSILFVDQVESTRLLAAIGDDAMVEVRRTLWGVIQSEVSAHGGRVFSDEGDGGAAIFDTAPAAAAAAVGMVQRASEQDLSVRAGVHSGEVVTNGDGFVGLAVHIAARLCDEAPAGHVVVSGETANALGSGRGGILTPFGHRLVKGIDDPIEVSLLTAEAISDDERDQLITPVSWTPLLSSPLLTDPTNVVGRQAVLRDLRSIRARARSGRPQLALIAGDPGEGKTTLAHSLAREAHADGAVCLIGRADEAFDDPFAEAIEMLGHLVATAPTDLLATHVLRHGDLLTRLLPGLADRVPSAGRGLQPDSPLPDRRLLFEAVADLVRSVAQHQHVVLIIEDIHWSSASTLDLLRWLVRAGDLGPVLMLATYRPSDVEPDGDTEQFLRRMTRQANAETVSVDELSVDDIAAFAAASMGLADAEALELAAMVHRQTGGNALFSAEVVAGLERTNDADGHEGDGALVGALVVPPSMQDLARSRAERLGSDVAHVLTDAAVLGETFDLATLRRLAAVNSPVDVLTALDRAERAGLVAPDDDIGRRFRFRHALMQVAMLGRLSAVESLRRHRSAADALAHQPAASAAAVLRHLRSAGALAEPEEIVAQATLAAAEALDRLALDAVVECWSVAADAAEGGGLALQERARLLGALGRAQTNVGRTEGKQTMVAAAALARECNDWQLFAEIAVDYGGDVKENQAVFARAEPIALIREALAHHEAPSATRARLLVTLALWQRQSVAYAERRPLVDEALDIAASLDEPAAAADVFAMHHRALHGPNISEEAWTVVDRLASIAETQQDERRRFQAANIRLMLSFEQGNWEQTQERAATMIDLVERLQHIEGRRLATMWRGLTSAMRGDRIGNERAVAELRALLTGYAPEDLGRLVGALAFPSQWLAGYADGLYQALQGRDMPATTFALFAADAGRPADAMAAVDASGGVAAVQRQSDYQWWHDMVALTRAARCGADTSLAEELYDAMSPYRERNATMGLVAFLGAAHHHLGTLSAVLGDHDGSVAHFDRALERHRQMGASAFVALTQAERSATLAARNGPGDVERARWARSEAETLGHELELGLVLATL